MSRIYVGTCNWSDHAGFYPSGLPSNQQITYYAQRFPLVEIDSTFYRLMPVRNFTLWAERTPPGFVFDVKAFRQLTYHDRETPPNEDVHAQFSTSVQPLRDAGKLEALHFQFPPWFVFGERNVSYLSALRGLYPEDGLAVEFRHRSWYEAASYGRMTGALREAAIGLTVVDEPQVGSGSVPTVLEVTTPGLSTIRFHGRNAKMWYARVKTTAERFNYLYNEQELDEWVPNVARLAELASTVHVLFNNNAQDYAVQNGRQLRMLLREGLPDQEIVGSPEE
jgi:uncharacterized protein YecE (DUF72 family)